MRELDLLLARFLESGFERLDADGLAGFERLLESPDQDILAWLCGASDPPAGDVARAVRVMRDAIGTTAGAATRSRTKGTTE